MTSTPRPPTPTDRAIQAMFDVSLSALEAIVAALAAPNKGQLAPLADLYPDAPAHLIDAATDYLRLSLEFHRLCAAELEAAARAAGIHISRTPPQSPGFLPPWLTEDPQ